MRHLRVTFALLVVLSTPAWATTYYIAPATSPPSGWSAGSDGNNGLSKSTPKASFSGTNGVWTVMAGGDTCIWADGTYSDKVGWNGYSVPSGSAGAYTTFKAEHVGGVMIDGSAVVAVWSSTVRLDNVNYIQLEGLRFTGNPSGVNIGLVLIRWGSHHIKILKCGFLGTPWSGNNAAVSIGAGDAQVTDILVEDSWVWGYTRYKVLLFNTSRVVLRRVVARHDYHHPYPDMGRQSSCFTPYDSTDWLMENCVCIDSGQHDQSNGSLWGGVWSENNAGVNNRGVMLGNVFLNLEGYSAINDPKMNTGARVIKDNVIWDSEGGYQGNVQAGSPTLLIDHSTFGRIWGDRDVFPEPAVGAAAAWGETTAYPNILTRNSLIYDMAEGGIVDLMTSDYNDLYGNARDYHSGKYGVPDPSPGAHDTYLDPGMKYVTRIERDSPVKGTASDGGDRGANVLYQYGMSGTLWGEPGYDQLTTTPLWPFPYEELIRADFRTYVASLITVTHGSADYYWSGDGSTRSWPFYLMGYDPGSVTVTVNGVAKTVGTTSGQYRWNPGTPVGRYVLTMDPAEPTPSESDTTQITYRAVTGFSGDRGFCADGQTLTNYIWGYLGNAVPPLGLVATPGSGSLTLNWARPADIALPTITGFNIYRIDGGQHTIVGTVDGNATYTATVTGLDSAGSYAFAMTTLDSQKGESGLSEVVTIGTPDLSTVSGSGTPPATTKTVPMITWATPGAITAGTALGSTQLNATANVAGTFTYSPAAGTVLAVGTYTINATFTPSDSTLYATATAYMSLTVNAVAETTPTITWATPAAIAYGTALGSTQLNASVSVPGTLVYSPAAGTVLAAGTQTLTVNFTPTNTSLHNSASATRSLTVNAAPAVYRLTVTRPTGGTVQSAGINCGTLGTACQVTMPASMSLGLQAIADSGYVFTAWSGDCSGTSASYALSLTGAKTCGATFTAAATAPPGSTGGSLTPTPGTLTYGAPYRLTITRGSGGTVKSAGINCGTTAKACEVQMPAPMTLGLQATPDAGYTFTGWSGDCSGTSVNYWLALEGPRTCAATFVAAGGTGSSGSTTTPPATTPGDGSLPMGAPYTLTVTQPSGGTIKSAGVNCGKASSCSVTMPAPMRLGLEATPDKGYVFSGWTGHCSAGTSAGYFLSLDGPRTCGAVFVGIETPTR